VGWALQLQGQVLGMLCGPAIMEFLIPLDSLNVWFIYFVIKKKKKTLHLAGEVFQGVGNVRDII
jgi:hypothetical protein